MLRSSELACLVAVLISFAATTSSEAKVLRNKGNASTVLIFRDADALLKFGKVAKAAVYDDAIVTPLLACKAPQGSRIAVLGSGDRTAFVRVVEGSSNGCEGTVPKDNVRINNQQTYPNSARVRIFKVKSNIVQRLSLSVFITLSLVLFEAQSLCSHARYLLIERIDLVVEHRVLRLLCIVGA